MTKEKKFVISLDASVFSSSFQTLSTRISHIIEDADIGYDIQFGIREIVQLSFASDRDTEDGTDDQNQTKKKEG